MLSGRLLKQDWGPPVLLGILGVLCVVVPVANLLVPEDSVFHVSTYTVTLLGKYLCYALLAMALDLVWGYCGILSLGHGAFFALGGYAMGMYLMRQIGTRGVYGDPELPDFMVFLNWEELPWYWFGFDAFWFAMLMVVLVPGLLALVFGWLAFRSRVTGVYLSIMTQALTYALMLAFFRNEMGFGGNNGLTDFKRLLGFTLRDGEVEGSLATYPYFNEYTKESFLKEILETPDASGNTVAQRLEQEHRELRLEPGRSLLNQVGVTLARVVHRKKDSRGDHLVGLEMNMSQLKSSSADFLLDPFVSFKNPDPQAEPVAVYFTGAYCLERDVLLKRKIQLAQLPKPGDVVCFVNTAGYMMHFFETEAHLFERATNLSVEKPDGPYQPQDFNPEK